MSNININCNSVNITPRNNNTLDLEISGVWLNEILDEFELNNILQYLDHDKILEIIGVDKCKEHFNLCDKSDLDKVNE